MAPRLLFIAPSDGTAHKHRLGFIHDEAAFDREAGDLRLVELRRDLNPATQTPLVKARFAMVTILVVILLLMALGALPAWPHSRDWGYGPSGGLGLVFIILLVLLFTGRL